MYKSSRARLGSSLTLSPYEKQKRWLFEHMAGIFLSFCCCILFFGLLYLVSAMIVFFGGRYFMNLWDEDEGVVNAAYIYARPWMELVRWVGCGLILFFTFRNMQKES